MIALKGCFFLCYAFNASYYAEVKYGLPPCHSFSIFSHFSYDVLVSHLHIKVELCYVM